MYFTKKAQNVVFIIAVAIMLGGCSTIGSAYEKTKETVSGWFKSEPEKK